MLKLFHLLFLFYNFSVSGFVPPAEDREGLREEQISPPTVGLWVSRACGIDAGL